MVYDNIVSQYTRRAYLKPVPTSIGELPNMFMVPNRPKCHNFSLLIYQECSVRSWSGVTQQRIFSCSKMSNPAPTNHDMRTQFILFFPSKGIVLKSHQMIFGAYDEQAPGRT